MSSGERRWVGAAEPTQLLARARVGLATVNFPLAYLALREDPSATVQGELVCGGFLLWTLASLTLQRDARRSDAKSVAASMLDVLAATALVGATGGASSPFVPWITFAALGTAGTRHVRRALLIGVAALAGLLAVGTKSPLPGTVVGVPVAALWTVVYAGFAFRIGGAYDRNRRLLEGLESFGTEIAEAREPSRALEAFRRAVETIARPSSVVVRLEGFGEKGSAGPDAPNRVDIPFTSGSESLGEARIGRRRRFSAGERLTLGLLGERLASALVRIRLSAELLEEAARRERSALADELHDTTIQTLTALDMGATLLGRLVAGDEEAAGLAEELAKEARAHLGHVRNFLRDTVAQQVPGPESLRALLEERWAGRYELRLDPQRSLSEARWRLLATMAREGLSNAQKHGGATHVRMTVEASDERFEARLEADGAAPPDEVVAGYGLARLRAVAAAQNATVELGPRAEGGSSLTVRAPGRGGE